MNDGKVLRFMQVYHRVITILCCFLRIQSKHLNYLQLLGYFPSLKVTRMQKTFMKQSLNLSSSCG